MSNITLGWHDYETFGVNPRRDRPAQFAFIRTDMDLNIVDEPIMIYCKPTLDYIPDPIACTITGITPQVCIEKGLPEHKFARIIQDELGKPGTVGVGYNTIKFDDEVTRFMFWRNLMDPYSREWKNGCGRWDLINLSRAAFALRPEGIVWPKNAEGKQSFRLEDLTKANGLTHEAAHDALSDVHATIAFARLIKSTNPKLFDHFFGLHRKAKAAEHMDVRSKEPFIHVVGTAAETGGVSIMMPIAVHPKNKNEVIAWDLTKDPRQLLDIDADTMRARMFTKREDQTPDFVRMPIRTIATNKSPFVVKDMRVLSAERAALLGIDKEAALTNADVLRDVIVQRKDLDLLFRAVYSRELEKLDVDENLYGGFVENNDRATMDRLTQMGAGDLLHASPRFHDEQLQELFIRYKGRNFPNTLTPEQAEKFSQYLREKMIIGKDGSRTFEEIKRQISEMRVDADPKKISILDEIVRYVDLLEKQVKLYIKNNDVFLPEAEPTTLQHTPTANQTYDGLISSLKPNQVFVFGSNPAGINGNPSRGTGGSALVALKNGWVEQGEKMDNCLSASGKSWGLTTVAYPGQKQSKTKEEIIAGIAELYAHAEKHPDQEFLIAYTVSKRNLNGYPSEDIAAMFGQSPPPQNIIFEKNFLALVRSNPNSAGPDNDRPKKRLSMPN